MALASVGSFGTFQSKTANQSSMAFVTTATLEAGNFAVLVIALDNNQTTDGDEGAVSSITDTSSNTWTKGAEFTNGQGSAQAGATCSLWYSSISTQLNSGSTITINLTNSASRDATAATGWEFTKSGTIAVEGTPGTLAHDGGSGDIGSLDVTTANVSCLRVRGIAIEHNDTNNITPTSSWTAFTNNQTTPSTPATNMGVRAEFIISTATGAASLPTVVQLADAASVYIAFKEASTAYTLTAAVGTFTLTGVAAVLSWARKLTADVGTYVLNGIDATLTFVGSGTAYQIAADVGAYVLTGIDATITSVRSFAVDAGSYALTGVAVGFGRSFQALAGAYALTGQAVAWSRSILHAAGAYTLTGMAAAQQIAFSALAGAYTLTGMAATMALGRRVIADAGAYVLTGVAQSLAQSVRSLFYDKRRKQDPTLSTGRVTEPSLVSQGQPRTLSGVLRSLTLRRRLIRED